MFCVYSVIQEKCDIYHYLTEFSALLKALSDSLLLCLDDLM